MKLHNPRLVEKNEPCNCEEAIKFDTMECMKVANEIEEKKRIKLNRKLKSDILKLFGQSGLSQRARLCTFDNYIITEQNRHAFNEGQTFIKNFNKCNTVKYGLFIAGNIGVGKSFLAFCIANYLLCQGYSVIVTTPEDLLNNIRYTYYKEGKTEHEILKIYKDVDLLIFDDVGKEELSEWGIAKLNNILYYRHENFKSVIFTTNYNDDFLIKRISPTEDLTTAKSILDRLYQTCKAIIITGDSWRNKNVQR